MARTAGFSLGFLAAVVALIFSGLPQSHGQSEECLNKVLACSTMMGELAGAADNQETLALACNENFPGIQTCVDEGKTTCAGVAASIASLDGTLNGATVMCSAVTGGGAGAGGAGSDAQCMTKAAPCLASITPLVVYQNGTEKAISDVDIPKLCQAMSTVKPCLENVEKDNCDLTELKKQMNFDMMAEICKVMTDANICGGVFSCATKLKSDAGFDCSGMVEFITCLKTAECKSSKGISHDKLIELTNNLCTDLNNGTTPDLNCSAVNTCTLREYGVTGDTDKPLVMIEMFTKLYQPNELCRYIEKGTGCSVSEGVTCGYKTDFINKMKAHHETFKTECAKTSNGAGSVVPQMAWLLASLLVWKLF